MSDEHDSAASSTVDEAPDEAEIEAEQARREAHEGQNPDSDGEETGRVAEAEKQENPDDHRDEPSQPS